MTMAQRTEEAIRREIAERDEQHEKLAYLIKQIYELQVEIILANSRIEKLKELAGE